MTNKEIFIQTWHAELKITAGAVRALPTDMSKLSYRCDETARSAAEIIGHMLPHAEAMCNATDSFVAAGQGHKTYNSIAYAAAYFEKYAKLLVDKLHSTNETTWQEQEVEFCRDGNKLFSCTMSHLFWMLMFDIIHHRDQLSTYYRPMGVRNPRIYESTAEDMKKMAVVNN